MNIYKYKTKKGMRYGYRAYLGVKLDGKPKNITKQGFETKEEAIADYSKSQKIFDKTSSVQSQSFEDIYKLWLHHYKDTVKESTLSKTLSYFRLYILPVFSGQDIAKIKTFKVQEAVNLWYEKIVRFKVVVGYTRQVFDYALRLGVIERSPFDRVIVPKNKKRDKNNENYYSKSELMDFLKLAKEKLSSKWYAFFRLLSFSGARKGELLALTWQDIDFKKGFLKINKTLALGLENKLIVQSPKTEKSSRIIDIDKGTLNCLKLWKKEQSFLTFKEIVFSSSIGSYTHLSKPRNQFLKIVENSDLKKITIHGFRHTHCSLLFESGASLKEVQQRLGHTDIKTTLDIYTHLSKGQKSKAFDKFAMFMQE